MFATGGGEGAAPAEIASLMRAAGLPPDGRYLVVAMSAEAEGVREFLACSGSWNACAAKLRARQHRALPDQADRGTDRA